MFTADGRLDTARFSRGLKTSMSDFYAVLTVCTETFSRQIQPSHFLLALTKAENSLTQKTFEAQRLQPETVVASLQEEITVKGGEIPLNLDLTREHFSPAALAMLEELEDLAAHQNLTTVDEKELLLAVLRHLEPEVKEEIFEGIIDLDKIIQDLEAGSSKPAMAIFAPDDQEIDRGVFDESGQLFLNLLPEAVAASGHTRIRAEHVGLALLTLEDGVSQKGLLLQLKNPQRIYREVMDSIQRQPPLAKEAISLDQTAFSRPVLKILNRAAEIAGDDGRTLIGESQLLRALLKEGHNSILGSTLQQLGVNFAQLTKYAAARPEVKITPKKQVENPWEDLKGRFRELEPFLKSRIIGQDQAIQVLIAKLAIAIFGLRDPDRPVGVLFFAGPTGVGKTEIARVLAEFIFGTTEALVRIDMSEYMASHSDARLIGPPPGYVGHEAGGQLTNKILEHPFSIIVFDEVEKAHSSIHNMFLQIFDAARLTDGKGREVRFTDTLIIATSNVGAQQAEMTRDPERQEEIYKQTFADKFTPEIRNRFSDVVYFNSLTKEACGKVLALKIRQLSEAYQRVKGISLSFSQEILEYLLEKGFDPNMGARPLSRTIDNQINARLSMEIALGKIKEGEGVHFDVQGREVVWQHCS